MPRTPPQLRARPLFKPKTIEYATRFLLDEIDRLNYPHVQRGYTIREHVIVSTNLRLRIDGLPWSQQARPADPGVAVYFPLHLSRAGKRFERPIVLTCDRWVEVAWNIYAIAKDIEAQRGRERWGCTNYEQAFRGYLALPAHGSGAAWWETLKIQPTATKPEVERAFKTLALKAHPDKGGSADDWNRLQEAYQQALAVAPG